MPENTGAREAVDVPGEGRGLAPEPETRTVPALGEMFRRLFNAEDQSRAARTVEYFGWLDMSLGTIILMAPYFTARLLNLPTLSSQDANYLRLVGLLVGGLGMLYVVAGRLNAQGFIFASLLDRPLVPAIMTVLWYKGILPGSLAVAFSASDFGGFLWTLWAWRADARSVATREQPQPSLGEMFRRLCNAEGQSRAARTVEYFGWLDMVLGTIILLAPGFTAWLLNLPALTDQATNYLRLVGLLVGGLGVLYVAAGRLNTLGFSFASLLDRPLVPAIATFLWYHDILPGTLALAFAISDFGGFLWTLQAWRADVRYGPGGERPRPGTKTAAWIFGFISGVVRNARTFHPDGRVFRGTVTSLHPADPGLASASEQLAGTVLMRMGMGLMKKSMPLWLADRIPDAPSIALRFSSSSASEIRLQRRPGEDLDLLVTAGGDRLWKLVVNLMLGGKMYGLNQYDYFSNGYYSQVPYRIEDSKVDVWVRLVPNRGENFPRPGSPRDGAAREQDLTNAVAHHAVIGIEVQRVGDPRAPFVPIAQIRFEQEIEVDQESLHFDPVAGRGFEPHGFFTEVRKLVYPVSVQSRPASVAERAVREHESRISRLGKYVQERSSAAEDEATTQGKRRRAWLKITGFLALAVFVLFAAYMAIRFTSDYPVAVYMKTGLTGAHPTDYPDDVHHFMYGSTGGERTNGIPYWFWVALPEIFSDELPDHKAGQGYKAFGMIYEDGKDPRYDLPVGVSMRHFRGIDVVYLNCAACHTGTVRDFASQKPQIVPGMPAHTFNLGAWGQFLTSVVKEEKFTPDRIMDQIDYMQDSPHRLVEKPDLINRLIFRYYAVHLMRQQLITLGDRLSFIHTDTWGPGRVDTFNAPKALLNFPMKKYADPDELVGNADFPSVWNQRPREGMQLHWDGNNALVAERNLSAAFGTGAYPPTLDAPRVQRTARYLETATPPSFPAEHIDGALAQRGKQYYQERCVGCHGWREPPFRHNPPEHGEDVGTVDPIDDIGTDRARLNSYTWPLMVNQSTLYAGYERDWGFAPDYPQRFSHFRKQPGYANLPLDGIWLRAPYLHNGSVPNLWELLKPAEERAEFFCRGGDVYDYRNVGFVSEMKMKQDKCDFFLFDTHKTGNGKSGHTGHRFGTDLLPDQKWALIEYLKTF